MKPESEISPHFVQFKKNKIKYKYYNNIYEKKTNL